MRFSSEVRLLALGALCSALFAQGPYVISTIAGGAPPSSPTNAWNASIGFVHGLAVDGSGNVFFTSLHCLFKVDRNGILTLVAGNSRQGYSGDGGPGPAAQMIASGGIAIGSAGNIFVADSARVRKVSPAGVIATVAGGGPSFPGDGGPATNATMFSLSDVAVDASGNIYVAEPQEFRIQRVTTDGVITTVAGTGVAGFSGDGGQAINAQLNLPEGVAVDAGGNLFIADYGNFRVRKVTPSGVITTVAGNGSQDLGGTITAGALATSVAITPLSVSLDPAGNVLLPTQGRLLRISTVGTIAQVVGPVTAPISNGVQATGQVRVGRAVADASGNIVFVSDEQVWRISSGGAVSLVAGNGGSTSGNGVLATSAQFGPTGPIAVDGAGNLFVVDLFANIVRQVGPDGIVTTKAGGGNALPTASEQLATSVLLAPSSVAVDGAGNLFVEGALGLYKVSPNGTISTVAAGVLTDGCSCIGGMTIDGTGNLYVPVGTLFSVLKISQAGVITTIAGNGTFGFSGDGGQATSAQLNGPSDVAVDATGNVFIADSSNHRIRKVDTNGVITTVAGNGTNGQGGDGVPALSVGLNDPTGIAVDKSGNLFIADYNNGILEVMPDGKIHYVAGSSVGGYNGDGGPASVAHMYEPCCVRVDSAGNLYVSDTFDNAVRILKPSTKSTIVGSVVDAASESAIAVSPGKIVVAYGAGLGPAQLVQNQPTNGAFGTQAGGTTVSFNGIPAPLIYTSATQVAAIAPYEISGNATAQVTVSYQGQISSAFTVPVASSAPSFFSLNGTGAGQAAAVNVDGSINDALHPVKIGGYVSMFATGEGQTSPAGVDGKLASAGPYPQPLLPVSVTVDGLPANVTYAGAAPTEVAGLMQIVLQIPQGVQPGGYVPVVLTVGNASTVAGAAWIAVARN